MISIELSKNRQEYKTKFIKYHRSVVIKEDLPLLRSTFLVESAIFIFILKFKANFHRGIKFVNF